MTLHAHPLRIAATPDGPARADDRCAPKETRQQQLDILDKDFPLPLESRDRNDGDPDEDHDGTATIKQPPKL